MTYHFLLLDLVLGFRLGVPLIDLPLPLPGLPLGEFPLTGLPLGEFPFFRFKT